MLDKSLVAKHTFDHAICEKNDNISSTLLDNLIFSIRLIQEEKFNTEQRAEELEHRVGTGSVDNFDIFNNALGGGKSGRPHHSYWDTQPRNLTRSLPGSMVMPLDLDRVSPPHSGSSTPVSSRRSTPADILGSQYSYSQPQISNMAYLGGGSDTETGAISKVSFLSILLGYLFFYLQIWMLLLYSSAGSYIERKKYLRHSCLIAGWLLLSDRILLRHCKMVQSTSVNVAFQVPVVMLSVQLL